MGFEGNDQWNYPADKGVWSENGPRRSTTYVQIYG